MASFRLPPTGELHWSSFSPHWARCGSVMSLRQWACLAGGRKPASLIETGDREHIRRRDGTGEKNGYGLTGGGAGPRRIGGGGRRDTRRGHAPGCKRGRARRERGERSCGDRAARRGRDGR